MIISTRENEYYVIRTLEGKPDRYICRDGRKNSSLRYSILRLPITEVNGDMIRYLMSQVKNEDFQEFIDYTTDSDYLYVIMGGKLGMTFQSVIEQGDLTFKEKLTLALNCLEHIFTSDFPSYFIHSALCEGTFRITKALDVRFQFDLKDFQQFSSFGVKQAAYDIGVTFENLFKEELDKKYFGDMADFITRLKSGSYTELIDIYKEYKEIYKVWKNKGAKEIVDDTPSSKFKRFITKLLDVLKKSALILVLIAALIYLVISIYNSLQPLPQKKVYDRIGDQFIIYNETEVESK